MPDPSQRSADQSALGAENAPIFFSLPTAFVIRNLALGSCLRRVLQTRPVVAAVHPYAVDELKRLFADQPLQLVGHRGPPPSNGRDWQRLDHYLQEGSKNTSGIRLSSRVYRPSRSRWAELLPGIARGLGWGLSRLGALST